MKTRAEINQLAQALKPIVKEAIEECTDEILNVRDVSKMLGTTENAIRLRCCKKQIPHRVVNHRLYFSKNEIVKYFLGK